MFYRHGLPLLFVFLWSSAFITAKVGVEYATPFALLFARFTIVAVLFGAMLAIGNNVRRTAPVGPSDSVGTISFTALVGLLLHGGYLGSVFLALSIGLPAGMAALIVSMQPLLSAFCAHHLALRRTDPSI